jgi:hypothetical protein
MISGDDDGRGYQYIRPATQIIWTSDSLPEIRDEKESPDRRKVVRMAQREE